MLTEMLAKYFQGLTHPTRIAILNLLKGKDEMCVCEIVEKLGKEQSNVSRHLNALRTSGIVEFRSEGARSLYRIGDPGVFRILELARSSLRRQAKERHQVLSAS